MATAAQPSLVGTWEWTRKSNNCAEQYTYRADGTVSVKSGERQMEGTYLIAWAPEPNGRYKLTKKKVKDSGGRDCSDSGEDSQRSVAYLLFGQSGTTMIQCKTADGPDCVGPLRKVAN
jgi:hypothetical protein